MARACTVTYRLHTRRSGPMAHTKVMRWCVDLDGHEIAAVKAEPELTDEALRSFLAESAEALLGRALFEERVPSFKLPSVAELAELLATAQVRRGVVAPSHEV